MGGIYHQHDPATADHQTYMQYIRDLPINDTPEIFGLHDNANITFAQNETFSLLEGILLLQPKSSSAGGSSREEIIEAAARSMTASVPKPVSLKTVMERYPVMYEESMNTVLIQEVTRYNKLLSTIHSSLQDLLKALKGLVVMSESLEMTSNSIFINHVPDLWAGKAYPSLKPLAAWIDDLIARMKFINDWIDNGIPAVFWISGFFFPQGFLTGTLQNFARAEQISIDTISFDFEVMKQAAADLSKPAKGVFISGLYLEGARWGHSSGELAESRAKELYTDMPIIWLKPEAKRVKPKTGFYDCPVYKTLTRAGTLSTTGHSTNFVVSVELPTSKDPSYWIKQGVALMCALDF